MESQVELGSANNGDTNPLHSLMQQKSTEVGPGALTRSLGLSFSYLSPSLSIVLAPNSSRCFPHGDKMAASSSSHTCF